MIKAVTLYNFQGHRELHLGFSPGITVIKGRTDAGKSAILRAIRWALLNDLSGDDFISWGRKEAVASIDLIGPKGLDRIARRKGVSNLYRHNGKPFVSFGVGKVPDTIASIIQMNEINFQRQHDSPFWLGLSNTAEVSRQLNRVIDLSAIDQTTAAAGRLVRSARDRLTVSQERLAEREARLEELKNGQARIDKFKILKDKYDEHERIRASRDQLERILSEVDSCDAEGLARQAAASRKVFDAAIKWRRVSVQRHGLSELVDEIDMAEQTATALDNKSKTFYAQIMKIACPTCGQKNYEK